MTPSIQEMLIALQRQVYEQEYYTEQYEKALRLQDMTLEGVEKGVYSAQHIVSFATTFWWHLPDSMSIQRSPFQLVCDIAGIDYR